jgi:Arc/MetJ-type ribon-helix-helix transcriptional regulator
MPESMTRITFALPMSEKARILKFCAERQIATGLAVGVSDVIRDALRLLLDGANKPEVN